MIKPYTAVGLIPTVRGIRKRKDIKINLEHLTHLVKAAAWLSSLDIPVRLIAFPEGALQAFNDEVLDLDHATFARECAIDIPGDETDELGKIAKEYNAFVMAQAKAKHPDLKDRFFNVGFIINPRGKVILKHYKVSPLFPVEHSVCPHDVYDWWIEKYGRNLNAFWPVVETEIGRLGIMMANEGSYPENARALALNGAEVVYRASYPHPATGNEIFEIQSRARALDNNMYIVAPNMGTYYLFPEETTPIDTFGGRSFIIDYKGRIVGRQDYGAGSTYVGGVIDVEALRDHRARAQWDNWMKDLRTELYQLLYERPIYPKNLYLKRAPMKHAEYRDKVIKRQIKLMHDRDIPSTSTIAFDAAGVLYLARTGRRYGGGEEYDLWPIYRIPPGGARLTPDTERRYHFGPPLLNSQVTATRRGKDLFVTTFDRERKVGALYRMRDGRAELFAGGT